REAQSPDFLEKSGLFIAVTGDLLLKLCMLLEIDQKGTGNGSFLTVLRFRAGFPLALLIQVPALRRLVLGGT
ncbi:MAG TPA: hypothetical protein V6D50_21435, partial [Chroococcales cyanobacterium]